MSFWNQGCQMSVTRQPSAYSAVGMSVPAQMRNGAPRLTMSLADGIGGRSQSGLRRRSLQVEVVDSPSSGGRGRPREKRRTEAINGLIELHEEPRCPRLPQAGALRLPMLLIGGGLSHPDLR